jgi:hypothetical protein
VLDAQLEHLRNGVVRAGHAPRHDDHDSEPTRAGRDLPRVGGIAESERGDADAQQSLVLRAPA